MFFFFFVFIVFFFKQKTAYEIYQCDWSSDVCSSDLQLLKHVLPPESLPPTLSPHDRDIVINRLPKVRDWIGIADRIPPSDLLQRIIEETDYAACFIGRHGNQGWENLKKVLELIRRAQNRGYMTCARLSEYLDYASAGEESLAALETTDAVSLMTIHASKGLEFKAVFVVNMDQTLRTDTSLPRIKEHADGTIDVYATEKVERTGPDRALEEEKRLLYVALTRAKDYLVLSSLDATHRERHATFNNLLPKSLRELLPEAATTDAPELAWKPASDTHRLRVIRPASSPQHYHGTTTTPSHTLALEPLPLPTISRMKASHLADRKRGVSETTSFYRQLPRHPELTPLLQNGVVSREVPFVLIREEQRIRGSIDSLILLQDRAIVVDYKTEQPSETHRLQMGIYLEATQALFPKHKVEGLIFYPEGAPYRCSL